MTRKVIVLVADRDDPKHGEVTVLSDPRKAERLLETLLEAGFEQERIRTFSGVEMDIQITHRPVVALVGEESDRSPPADSPADREVGVEEDAGGEESAGEESAGEESAGEEAPASAMVPTGVRFSSLFRSA